MNRHTYTYIGLGLIGLVFIMSMIDLLTTPPTTPEMKQYAGQYLEYSNKPTPLEPFHQDGCSLFPDQLLWHDLRGACLNHDIKYWAGGSDEERKLADVAFRQEIAHTGPLGPVIAWLAYSGVRLFGNSIVTKLIDAEWGYGWDM